MTGFLPNNPQAPQHSPVPRKSALSPTDALRRARVMPPAQCRDNRAKLDNLRRLIAAAEREYREMSLELDRLNNEGRVWLVVDLIHKTALATLDLGAAIMQVSGLKAGDAVRALADGTQTFSDVYGGAAGVANGSVSGKEFARTLAQRALTHTPAKGAGAAYAKGTADLALGGWSSIDNITGAQAGGARNARTTEAAIEATAGLIQRTADTVDTPASKRVSAAAQIAKAMAGYNRELEGAFNRRLEISGGLMATKANFQAVMQRSMARYRKDAAELEELLEGCL